ncbi:MAG: hypothetical protein KGL46_09945 [Hyphomicrobiales bacterium]|nr:hypothetical protein [Hyphomicrobiales bacterium]
MRKFNFALAFLALAFSAAFARDLGSGNFPGGTTVQPCDTKNAFSNSSNPTLANNSQYFADMSKFMEDPSQQTGLHNSCCTGLMQMNQSNLKQFCGCTPEQYAQMSAQQQIDVYTKYFNSIQNTPGMTEMQKLADSGGTLGGHKIDEFDVIACAQMGPGNCAAAIKNGCSSLALGQGGDGSVNVCTMADAVRSRAAKNEKTAFGDCANGGTKGGGTNCPGNGTTPAGVIPPTPGNAPVSLPANLA